MARVPTMAEEDAKRPNRECQCLVGERTRIVNRMKATLARLGVRNFKPTLRKAAERLATVHTPEGMPLPPNVSAELQRRAGGCRHPTGLPTPLRQREPRCRAKLTVPYFIRGGLPTGRTSSSPQQRSWDG
jgi:hypothetical protein